MTESRLRQTAALGLALGAALGMAGTFAPSDAWRALMWGVDGSALIVGTALLAVHHLRRGNEFAASNVMPVVVRSLGFVAALLFAVVAVRIFLGDSLTLASPV